MSSASLKAISYNIYVYIAKVLQPDTTSHMQLVAHEFHVQNIELEIQIEARIFLGISDPKISSKTQHKAPQT